MIVVQEPFVSHLVLFFAAVAALGAGQVVAGIAIIADAMSDAHWRSAR